MGSFIRENIRRLVEWDGQYLFICVSSPPACHRVATCGLKTVSCAKLAPLTLSTVLLTVVTRNGVENRVKFSKTNGRPLSGRVARILDSCVVVRVCGSVNVCA